MRRVRNSRGRQMGDATTVSGSLGLQEDGFGPMHLGIRDHKRDTLSSQSNPAAEVNLFAAREPDVGVESDHEIRKWGNAIGPGFCGQISGGSLEDVHPTQNINLTLTGLPSDSTDH